MWQFQRGVSDIVTRNIEKMEEEELGTSASSNSNKSKKRNAREQCRLEGTGVAGVGSSSTKRK